MSSPKADGKRVLVLDDDIDTARDTTTLLVSMGYRAQSETCPGKSIRYILEGKFDILLTDYQMPGLDGLQVAHILRTMGSMIPVILHAGECRDFCPEDLSLVGILGVIKKPISMNDFGSAFSSIFQAQDN
jgi:two-component system, cell cycle sensor histidine kinase and response regulator CckA